ncbi:MAG: hypothetical protein D8M59_15875 [Planctomycetes bacterium]|nr:hypothetical protein [Planctomycetota bacterium]
MALVSITGTAMAVPQHDPLDEALSQAGLQRADLGWRPKGYWSGYPADIPYKLRQFDDLLAEPLANVSYMRTMGNAARLYLDPATLDEPIGGAIAGNIYQAVHRLGVVRKTGVFRSYSCNLTAEPTPLYEAMIQLYGQAGRETRFITFGQESPYPMLEKELAAECANVPDPINPILGRLVLDVLDAHHWASLSFRNVTLEQRTVVAQRLNVGEEMTDALEYCPEFDDVSNAWDEPSMWYAGLKCAEALDRARAGLKAAMAEGAVGDFSFDWESPFGWVRIRGAGDDTVDGNNALLIVDLGGDDVYTGSAASSNAQRPIGLLLDLEGNDQYGGTLCTQGAGITGIGMLLDAEGDDRYSAKHMSQGVGQFGLGACIDLEGDDVYNAGYSSQGCGYFGIGLCLDAEGDDEYRLLADGQGLGGVAGVGVLADREGNDLYYAEPNGAISGRFSYHSEKKMSVSNAQGCALGRRGDGGDGHSWAGGMGALVDLEGDDRYVSGNWSQGTGYWFGMGFLYDGDGNDSYRGSVWSQGAGAHFCIGVIVDDGDGNDHHLAAETSTNSLAFGHDFAVAMLLNMGGNDIYELQGGGMGMSINRSVAMLIDAGGDDIYRMAADSVPGSARYDAARFADWSGYSTYFADASSVGLFLDAGGHDSYEVARVIPEHHAIHMPSAFAERLDKQNESVLDIMHMLDGCGNNRKWGDGPDSANWAVRNFGIGVDTETDAVINWLPIPSKPVGGKVRP